MQILIPSYGRAANKTLTHHWLPSQWLGKVTYVVHPSELEDYRARLQPEGVEVSAVQYDPGNMGTLRRRAMKQLVIEDKFLFLDDDIRFYVRREDNPERLRYTEEADAEQMLEEVEEQLNHFQHVGISHREGNNRFPVPHVQNVRCTRASAFNKVAYLQNAPTLQLMEDFDVALQMLASGNPYCVLTYWAQGQAGTQAKGGCSSFRTNSRQAEAARALAAKFPDFVKLRNKKTKGGLGESLDVTIYWKKAYESSQR